MWMMQGSMALASRAAQLTKATHSAGRISLGCQDRATFGPKIGPRSVMRPKHTTHHDLGTVKTEAERVTETDKRRGNVIAKAQDPESMDSMSDAAANQGPPTLFWRIFAALCYLVPWIDSISLGREIYRRFRNLLVLYLVPGPLAKVYFSSQFAPLIIFFVMFLSIVKNKKLHHFVRFNCMQAIMLDIVVMLMHIVKAYLPAEVKWSVISKFVDMFMWTTCMGTVVYAVFWTLRGYYADIPFVSESVYHQVALSEYA